MGICCLPHGFDITPSVFLRAVVFGTFCSVLAVFHSDNPFVAGELGAAGGGFGTVVEGGRPFKVFLVDDGVVRSVARRTLGRRFFDDKQ